MQDGDIHTVQSRPHLLYRPDGALLRGLLGAVHGNRAFDKDAPLYGILEGCTQQPMNLVDRRAGKKPLLLLFRQFLLLSLDIRTARRFAQGRIEVLHVVGLELLRLHAADTAGRHGTGERSHGEPSRPFLYTVHAVVGSLQFQLTIKMR